MNNFFLIFFLILILALFSEIILRFKKIIYMPLKFKILYCFFLLSKNAFIESYVLCQRVHRGGFKNLHGLMLHYSKISNVPIEQIYKKFIPNKASSNFYSGAHDTIDESFDAKFGYKAIPNQTLQTVHINIRGLRYTKNIENISKKKVKKIIFLGGSVMFGLGATEDEKTIPSMVSWHLNNNKNTKFYYECYNYAYCRDDSYIETIKLAENKDKPSFVISLSGYNDIISKLRLHPKPSSNKYIHNFLKQFLILRAIKRFFVAYSNYDSRNNSLSAQKTNLSTY